MEAAVSRRTLTFRDTLRRLVRRGSRGHITRLMEKLRPEDLAVVLPDLTPGEQQKIFQILREDFPEAAGHVLIELEPPQRVEILQRMEPVEIAAVLEHTAVDDAVALVGDLPPELKEPLLELVEGTELEVVQSQLTYHDDSAGRIMDTEFFALPETTTVKEAIDAIREQQEVEMIFYLYVIDARTHLVGVTSLRQLLLSRPEKTLREIMSRDLIKVETETDQEEVAQLAARYDLLAIPVTDHRNRLVGIVTVDDIVDIFKEEATEDFYKMVGTSDDEILHQRNPMKVAGIRLPWLLVNLVGLVVTGLLLESFQVQYDAALFLLTFVPAIMGMGGNSGSQTSTIAVRGLATGRLRTEAGGILEFVRHQTQVGAIIGLATGVLVAVAALLLEKNPFFALVVGLSLCLAILTASMIGALVPMLFERFGIDPAVASGPLVTTSSDVLGILIYFGLVASAIRFILPA
jgi:magnesium transporter